jgi:ParB family chromosome partitioning protein
MAMKINAGGDVRRGDLFYVKPSEVILDEAENGRAERTAEALRIGEMVSSLKAHGQLQPIVVRRLPDHRIQAVAGYRRLLALLEIERTDPDVRVMCRVTEQDADEAFVSNIIENLERKTLTPIDVAGNMRRLAEEKGWEAKKIAALFRMDEKSVADYRKLLTLPPAVKARVAAGKIPMSAAVLMGKLDGPTVDAMLAGAETSGRRIPGRADGGRPQGGPW